MEETPGTHLEDLKKPEQRVIYLIMPGSPEPPHYMVIIL